MNDLGRLRCCEQVDTQQQHTSLETPITTRIAEQYERGVYFLENAVHGGAAKKESTTSPVPKPI